MRRILLVVTFVVTAHCTVLAQGSTRSDFYNPGDPPKCNVSISREFIGFTEDIARDFTKNVSNLNRMLPDNFISTWADGEVLNKQQFLSLRADPSLKVQNFRIVNDQSYNACLNGYFAVATGIYVIEARIGDRDLSGQYRFTAVYAKHPGLWKPIAFHSSRLAQQTQLKN